MLALWRFFAGDSRIAPAGIAAALAAGALGVRLGWPPALTSGIFTAIIIGTLALASGER